MSLTQNFSTSQVLGEPGQIIFTDTSTGSDVAVVSRRIYPTDSAGNEVVEDGTATAYEVWSGFPGTTTRTLDLLESDKALSQRVDWVDINGNVLYTKTITPVVYDLYAKTYYLFIIKSQSSNTRLIDSANFFQNLTKLLVSIQEAEDAAELGADILSAQAALNRAKTLINSPSNFF